MPNLFDKPAARIIPAVGFLLDMGLKTYMSWEIKSIRQDQDSSTVLSKKKTDLINKVSVLKKGRVGLQ